MTNVGTDRSPLSSVAKEAKATLETENLDAVADRGYFSSEEILACEEAGITVTLPKPMTSNSKAEGRFGKQDFRYVAEEDVYVNSQVRRFAGSCVQWKPYCKGRSYTFFALYSDASTVLLYDLQYVCQTNTRSTNLLRYIGTSPKPIEYVR